MILLLASTLAFFPLRAYACSSSGGRSLSPTNIDGRSSGHIDLPSIHGGLAQSGFRSVIATPASWNASRIAGDWGAVSERLTPYCGAVIEYWRLTSKPAPARAAAISSAYVADSGSENEAIPMGVAEGRRAALSASNVSGSMRLHAYRALSLATSWFASATFSSERCRRASADLPDLPAKIISPPTPTSTKKVPASCLTASGQDGWVCNMTAASVASPTTISQANSLAARSNRFRARIRAFSSVSLLSIAMCYTTPGRNRRASGNDLLAFIIALLIASPIIWLVFFK